MLRRIRTFLGRRPALVAVLAAALIAGVVVAIVLATGGGGPAKHAPTPTASTTTTPPTTPTAEQLGASVNRLFNSPGHTAAQIDAQLTALEQTGATIARSDALWEAAEPSPPTGSTHHYDWSFADRIAGALAAHGLRWLPIVDYSAPWAQSIPGQDHSAPSSVAAYGGYAAALAQRYGSGGTFWALTQSCAPSPWTPTRSGTSRTTPRSGRRGRTPPLSTICTPPRAGRSPRFSRARA